MPILSCAVEELPSHVFDPVIKQLTRRILDSLGCSEIIGDNIYINADWSTHSKTSTLGKDAVLSPQSFNVNANLQMNPTSQKWDTYTFTHTTAYGLGQRLLNNAFTVYADPVHQVRIIKMISPFTIVMNCELILKSSDVAFSVPQMIFNEHENGSVYHYNDLWFDFPVPKPIVSVLYGIWQIDRDHGKPANVPFTTYLKNNSGNSWQFNQNRDHPEQREVVIPLLNMKALATLEYSEDRPSGVMKDRLPVAFSIPFVFTVQFGLPTQLILQFPVAINNQLLPSVFIPTDKVRRFNQLPEQNHYYTFEHLDRSTSKRWSNIVRCPDYDEWFIPDNALAKHSCMDPFMILNVLVEEDKPQTQVELAIDFDDTIKISPWVKEILYQQGEASIAESGTIYRVCLFENDREFIGGTKESPQDFSINDDLTVTFTPTDLNKHYRIVLFTAMDLNYIDPKWYDLLKKYYKFMNGAIKAQIKQQVLSGSWRDPNWPKDIIMDDNGDIWAKGDTTGSRYHTFHHYPAGIEGELNPDGTHHWGTNNKYPILTDRDGNRIDASIITNIKYSKYPNRFSESYYKEGLYAYNTTSRIVKYNIIPRKISKS